MYKKVRNQEVDILRGFAAILMILGYSFIVYPVNIEDIPWCSAIGHFIYNFHMELFFILSGYVYYCYEYKEFIFKKINRILIPYLVFGAGVLILRAYGGAINGNVPLSKGVLKLLFNGGGYWFLYVSFLIFVIYPLLELLICKNTTKTIILCLFFYYN